MATVLLSGCGEPLTPLEKELKSAQKQTARLEKKLDRMKRRNPNFEQDINKLSNARTKDQIKSAINRQDWGEVGKLHASLKRNDGSNANYEKALESQILDIVSALPASKTKENYEGYSLLSGIVPSNETYTSKASIYRERLLQSNRSAVKTLKTKYDKVDDITWYHHPNQTSKTGTYVYIGQKPDKAPWLRIRTQYVSEHGWIFVNSVKAWHDGTSEILTLGQFERQNRSWVKEWRDESPTKRQIELLKALADSKEGILRFEGDKRNQDVTLTRTEKAAIKDTLTAFKALQTLQNLEVENGTLK